MSPTAVVTSGVTTTAPALAPSGCACLTVICPEALRPPPSLLESLRTVAGSPALSGGLSRCRGRGLVARPPRVPVPSTLCQSLLTPLPWPLRWLVGSPGAQGQHVVLADRDGEGPWSGGTCGLMKVRVAVTERGAPVPAEPSLPFRDKESAQDPGSCSLQRGPSPGRRSLISTHSSAHMVTIKAPCPG